MIETEPDKIVAELATAFRDTVKPTPLTTFVGSQDDDEVRYFNALDWDVATYADFNRGLEGWIVCGLDARLYLLPKLLRMLVLRRHGQTDDAVDNIMIELQPELEKKNGISSMLTPDQRNAVINALSFLDRHYYYPSGSRMAKDFAETWSVWRD